MQLNARDKELVTFVRDCAPVSSYDLATRLDVSKRTVRNRIHRANMALGGVASIEYRDAGYELVMVDREAFDRMFAEEEIPVGKLPSTPDERVNYLLDDLLQREAWISIDRLSEILYVSRSCISRDLKSVEDVLRNTTSRSSADRITESRYRVQRSIVASASLRWRANTAARLSTICSTMMS